MAMRFVGEFLRVALFACIFAAIPASGQGNEAVEAGSADQANVREQRALSALDRKPEQPGRVGPDVRLLASEPALNELPRASLPVPADASGAGIRRAASGHRASPPAMAAHGGEGAHTGQPVALLAMPAAPPPSVIAMGPGRRVTMPGRSVMPGDALLNSWQQMLLMAALAIAGLCLFWWLGRRSHAVSLAGTGREPGAELALTEAMIADEQVRAGLLPDRFRPDEAREAIEETMPAPPRALVASDVSLPQAPPVRPSADDDGELLLDGSATPQFGSFHEAMTAMKAELARVAGNPASSEEEERKRKRDRPAALPL